MSRFKKKVREILLALFWRLASPLLRFLAVNSSIILTCTRNDGGGAQWHGRFSVMTFADDHKMGYVHSGFDQLMPEGSESKKLLWNEMFSGVYQNFDTLPSPIKVNHPMGLLKIAVQTYVKKQVSLIDINHLHSYTNLFPGSLELSLIRHRIRYQNPAKITKGLNLGPNSLVMHVRRALDWETAFTGNRNTDDATVLRRLAKVIELSGSSRGVLFSGTPNPHLESLLPVGFHFNHTADEFEVIHHMITAENIVLAKSCMSYISGALAKGHVFYEPFFHPPLSSWDVLET